MVTIKFYEPNNTRRYYNKDPLDKYFKIPFSSFSSLRLIDYAHYSLGYFEYIDVLPLRDNDKKKHEKKWRLSMRSRFHYRISLCQRDFTFFRSQISITYVLGFLNFSKDTFIKLLLAKYI